jgi:hypothetical protein
VPSPAPSLRRRGPGAGREVLAGLGLALYAAWELRGQLGPGLPLLFDAHSHLSRSVAVAEALEAGQYPGWSNAWYGGFRLLEFYSPGYYLVSGGLGLLCGDATAATKGLLWAGQIASTIGLYAWVRRLSGKALPALLAGVLLVVSPERTRVLGVIGNFPSLFLYALLPFLLLRISRCARDSWSPLRLFAAQSLLLGAMALGHLTNALILLPAVLAFEVLWLWQERPSRAAVAPAALAVAGSLVAVVGLTLFVTAPLLSHWDRASLSLAPHAGRLPGADPESLRILLGLAPGGLERPFVLDQGRLWLALGLAGGLLALRGEGRRHRPVLAGLCASLASVALLGERAALGTGFFLFALCAAAAHAAGRAASARGLPGARSLAPLLAIATAVLGAEHPTPRPPRYQAEDSMAVYRRLPETPSASRTFDVTPTTISLDGFYGQSSFSPFVSGRAIPFGGYPQGAPLAANLLLALGSRLVEELRAPEPALSEDALAVLYLMHVQFLVDRGEDPILERLVVDPKSAERLEARVLMLRRATPAIFSRRLAPLLKRHASDPALRRAPPRLLGLLEARWSRDAEPAHHDPALDPVFRTGSHPDWALLLPLVRAMAIDRATATAARLFPDGPVPPFPVGAGEPVAFAVSRHRERSDRVELAARASSDGFVRLSYTWDADLAVLLDGKAVSALPDLLGAVLVPFPAGEHEIEIRGPDGSPQPALVALSAALAIALLALAARAPQGERERARRRSR